MALTSGDTFAGYEVIRKLGAGGMGDVYLVKHPRLPRQYALKTLSASLTEDQDFRKRFSREAELAAELSHPAIVGVHDRGEFEGQLWIAMDYIDGVDAAQLLREHYPLGMPEEQVAEIVSTVADALDYAHERKLLHRDVKPANILIDDSNPKRRRIFLADFGIARRTDDIAGITATNTTIGSVAYAPPEQLMGQQLDGRADEYALAATAFHLLSGNPPFENSNPAVVISGHLNVPPPPLMQTRPELGHLNSVIAKAMSKSRDGRFATCREFAEALATQVGKGNATTPFTPPPPPAYAPPPSAPPPPPSPATSYPPPVQTYPPTPPPFQAHPPTSPTTPPAYWDEAPSQPSLIRPAVLIPVALVVVLVIGIGAFALTRLFSGGSSTTASSTSRATTASEEPEPSATSDKPTLTTVPSTAAIPSIPSVPGIPPPATVTVTAPTPTTISGIDENQSYACDNDEIGVSGIGNEVHITGHCLKVTVSGQKHNVFVENADVITVSGIDNVVTYYNPNAQVEKSGIDNTVQKG
jgi:serine/threonine-protein kinase